MAWHDGLFDVLFPSQRRLEAAFEQALAELEALGVELRRFEELAGGQDVPDELQHAVRRAVEGLSVANLHRVRGLVKRRAAPRAAEIVRRVEKTADEARELAESDRPAGKRARRASATAAAALRDLRELAAEKRQASRRIRILLASAYLVPIVASYLLGTWLRLGGGLELQEAAALAPRRAYVLVGDRFTLDPEFRSRFLSAFADYYFDRSKQAFEDYLEPAESPELETPAPAAWTNAGWYPKPAPGAPGPRRASVTWVQDEEFIPDEDVLEEDFLAIDDLLELDPEAESAVPLDRSRRRRPRDPGRPARERVGPKPCHPQDPTCAPPPSDPSSEVLYQDWKLVFRNTSRSQPEFVSSMEISATYIAAEPFPWGELPVEPDIEVSVDEDRVRADHAGSGPAVDLRCTVQDDAGLQVLESRLPRFVSGAMTDALRPPRGIGVLPVTDGDLRSVIYQKVEAPVDPERAPEGVEHRCIGWYRQLRTLEEFCAVTRCSRGREATAWCSYETLVDATRRVVAEERLVLGDDAVYYVDRTELRESDPCEERWPSVSEAPRPWGEPLLGIASALIHLEPLAGPPEGSDLIVQRATVDLFGLDQGTGKGRAVSVNRFLNPGGVLVLEVRTRGAANGGWELAVSLNDRLWRHGFEVLAPLPEHRSFLADVDADPNGLVERFRRGLSRASRLP